MTEKTAVLKTYILWSWLAQNPEKNKWDYPLYHELGYKKMHQGCPLCKWAETIRCEVQCTKCILDEAWQQCDREFSWYRGYLYGTTKEASIAAGNIAALAWKRYKELGG